MEDVHMKKMLIALIMVFGLNSMLHAVAYNAEIAGCDNSTQLVKFRVDDSGWYYVSVPFDSNYQDGWHFVTSWQTFQESAKGGNTKSFFVVTDFETGTPIVGRCL